MKQAFAIALSGLIVLQGAAVHAETSAGAPPSADLIDQARQHFQRGVEFYKDESFDAALAEFTRAYDLAANYRVLFNLGQVQLERHDYAAALELFRRYLDAGGGDISTERREQVEHDSAVLKLRVAHLRVKCNVDGAEVLVEGAAIAKTPMPSAVSINPGLVHVTVRKPGYMSEVRTFTLVGMEDKSIGVSLAPERPAPSPEPRLPRQETPAQPVPAARHGSRARVWIGLAVTGTLAVGAGILALRTRKANTDLDHALGTFPGDAGGISDARTQLKHYALATDVLTGSAVVAAGVTLYFTLSSPSDTGAPPAKLGLRSKGRGLELVADF